ncbi:MAG TPA: lysophospholipid acyltransferase family protein [Ignavibacteriales bacterium]|nr:lysophospholipid acyltransferase family protein [Ignavibacteriales bacterium]
MKFQHYLEYYGFVGLSKKFGFLGLYLSRRFALLLGSFIYHFIPIRKKAVIENLKIAFPERTPKEIARLAKKCYQSFALTFTEIMFIPYIKEEKLKNITRFMNEDEIRRKASENKGMIMFTAHFGNWEYGALAAPFVLGRKIYVVTKPQSNSLVSEWMDSSRARFGNEVIHLGLNIRNVYKILTQKQLLGIVGDQRGPKEGPRVKFFGRDAAIYTGAAAMGLKTKSTLLFMLVVRQKDLNYKVEVEEISFDNLPEGNEEQIIEICQRYFAILEKYIRKYPEQWFWMHKIWKY